jgi:hypothetical protein
VKNAGRNVSVSNANVGTAAIRVDAAGNYWGGGPADVSISGNVMLTPPTHLTSDPVR